MDEYMGLYRKAVSSKDPKKMKVLGEAQTWAFEQMAKVHPDMAENWLSHLEGLEWENFLSEKEAQNIGRRMTSQDGTKGAHWNYEAFGKMVDALGGKQEEKPYYNSYALWAVANMIYSDHAKSIAEDMGAVELFKDPDKGFNVRKYFKKRMYDETAE